jgi:hypothetical protein
MSPVMQSDCILEYGEAATVGCDTPLKQQRLNSHAFGWHFALEQGTCNGHVFVLSMHCIYYSVMVVWVRVNLDPGSYRWVLGWIF